MTDRTDPANPVGKPSKPGADPKAPDVAVDATGLTAQEHAAIMLRVPSSGTPWLDKKQNFLCDIADLVFTSLVHQRPSAT